MNDPLTERIIACAFSVANRLGPGFLEKVYENAMAYELGKCGLAYRQQQGIEVQYEGVIVGQFMADLVGEGRVILELKATRESSEFHTAQCLNYLKGANLPICLLINFQRTKLEWKRIIRSPGSSHDSIRVYPGKLSHEQPQALDS